ncbi:MAG TPA: hypothetical protein P5248_12415, partial [Bacteroidales bacterium]|nr:hypothetical protein [Bacteroidales bacterium]
MLHPHRPSGAILLFLIIWLLCILAFSGLALLLGSAVFGMEVVSAGAAAVDLPGGLSWLRTGQLINQVGVFFVPSFITALALYGRRGAAAALRLQTRTLAIPWLTALLLLPMALP